jgi:predicted porin
VLTTDYAGSTAGTYVPYESKRYVIVYSAEYTWNDLTVAAEYRVQKAKNTWPLFGWDEREMDAEGYYLGASYRFTDWLEVGSYYSEYYPDKDDKDGDRYEEGSKFQAWQKDWATTVRFDINDYWLIKLEGHVIDGVAGTILSADNPDGYEQDSFLFAIKSTFNF